MITVRLALLSGLLILSAPLHAIQDVSTDLAALLRKEKLEGAVWTTLDKEGAAGVSHALTGTPMSVTQRVQVGSIAKTMLALGVLRLVSEGRLSLDSRVAGILPSIRFDNSWEANDPVRVRHLLDHTSGLDDARLWHVFSLRAAAGSPLADAFPSGAGVLRIRQQPGTRVSYSNIGYTLLGMVVEAVAGQSYESYLDSALLAPLGMHDSSFSFVTQESDKRLAMGHFEGGITHPAVPSFVRPAGQFTTTAADMGRLARFLMSDGRLAGNVFIDPVLLQQMGEPVGTEAARAGLGVGYSLGLRRVDRYGTLAKCHGGNTVGFRAMLCLFPQTQKAFFIAINSDSEVANYAKFDALLTRSLILPTSLKAPVPVSQFTGKSWEGWYVAAPNRFDSFRYIDTVFNPLHLSSEMGGLTLQSLQAPVMTLRHVRGTLFTAPDKISASHALLISSDGTRVISTGTQSYEQVPLWYLLLLWISVTAGMLGLAYIVSMSLLRIAVRDPLRPRPLFVPFASVLALLLPIPFFYQQSFLQMGDLTMASSLLAAVTAALPLAMLAGLYSSLRRTVIVRTDLAAMLAVLQFSLVLSSWGLLPMCLWT